MKQKTINKLFALLIAILIVSVALLRVNEQDRVKHYICYDFYDSGYGMNYDEAKEFCDKILREE